MNQVYPFPSDVAWDDTDFILKNAEIAYKQPIQHIVDAVDPHSAGSLHDYSSNGDYWWPNPQTSDGLPYIRCDGETNPDNFNEHRRILREMRTNVVYLTAAQKLCGDVKYAQKAAQWLREFFLEPQTRMNPNLSYAQSIPGVCTGRGIGIIDTLHLVDPTAAIPLLSSSGALSNTEKESLQNWFRAYLEWLFTSENGRAEMCEKNNHSVCAFVQIAAFARFVGDEEKIAFCKKQYKEFLLYQMAPDRSFPLELQRTKPYSYSIFVLDNMVTLCALLSSADTNAQDHLWQYKLPTGQCIEKGISFLLPYILDKSVWPYPTDVMHFDAFPARAPFMIFAGSYFQIPTLLQAYFNLPMDCTSEEARRNIALRLPRLWCM